jgi:hypothetical protein
MNAIVSLFFFTILSIFSFLPAQADTDICLLGESCSSVPAIIDDTAGNTTENLSLSTNNIDLPVNSFYAVIINGNGVYNLDNNSSPSVASVSIREDFLSIKALSDGNTTITLCQSDGQCADISVTVTKPAKYKFTKKLQIGSTGKDVEELQKRLQAERLYVGKINGKFDANTRTALKKYQKLKKISPVGILGPLTRASLNK